WLDTSGTYFIDPNLTVASGATLTVGPGVHVQFQQGAKLTDNGTVTFGAGTAAFASSALFVVGNGGILNADSTTFSDAGVSTQIFVSANGRLTAHNSTFTLDQVS